MIKLNACKVWLSVFFVIMCNFVNANELNSRQMGMDLQGVVPLGAQPEPLKIKEVSIDDLTIGFLDQQNYGPIKYYRLGNGLEVILVNQPTANTTRVELLIKAGSKHESYGASGVAHLLEHLLFKSTENITDVKKYLNDLGAQWNGTTSYDRTNYFEEFISDPNKLEKALMLERDRLMFAKLKASDLASEMTVVRNEFERSAEQNSTLMFNTQMRQLFDFHGYARPVIGARSDIEKMPFERIEQFYKTYYRPDNAALIISGNLDTQMVLKLVNEQFGYLQNPNNTLWPDNTFEQRFGITNQSIVNRAKGERGWMISMLVPSYLGQGAREAVALDLFLPKVCSNKWGQAKILLEQKQFNKISCSTFNLKETTVFTVSVEPIATESNEVSKEKFKKMWVQWLEEGLSENDLKLAKLEEKNEFENQKNDHGTVSDWISTGLSWGQWDRYFWRIETAQEISLVEVNEAVKKWLNLDRGHSVHLENQEPVVEKVLIESAITVENNTSLRPKSEAFEESLMFSNQKPINSISDLIEQNKQWNMVSSSGVPIKVNSLLRQSMQGLVYIEMIFSNQTEKVFCEPLVCQALNYMINQQLKEHTAKLESLRAEVVMSVSGLSISAPQENIQEVINLVRNFDFKVDSELLDAFKKATSIGLEKKEKTPESRLNEAVALFWDNYPLNHPFKYVSTKEQQKFNENLNVEQLLKAKRLFYFKAAEISVGLLGATQYPESWLLMLTEHVERVENYKRIEQIAPKKLTQPPVISVKQGTSPNAQISLQWRDGFKQTDSGFEALKMAIFMLGGNSDSILWDSMREKEGLTYGVSAVLEASFLDPVASISIRASVAKENMDRAFAVMENKLNELIEKGVNAEQLAKSQKAWEALFNQQVINEGWYLGQLNKNTQNKVSFEYYQEYAKKMMKLTASDVNEVLKRLPTSKGWLKSMVSGE